MLLILFLMLYAPLIISVKLYDPPQIVNRFKESEEKLSWNSLHYRLPSNFDSIANMVIHIYTPGVYSVCTQTLRGGPWKCEEPFHRVDIVPCNLTMQSSSHTRYHRMTAIGITTNKELIRTSIVDIYDK